MEFVAHLVQGADTVRQAQLQGFRLQTVPSLDEPHLPTGLGQIGVLLVAQPVCLHPFPLVLQDDPAAGLHFPIHMALDTIRLKERGALQGFTLHTGGGKGGICLQLHINTGLPSLGEGGLASRRQAHGKQQTRKGRRGGQHGGGHGGW